MQEVRIDRKMTQQEMADALFISANTLKSKQGGAMCLPIRFGQVFFNMGRWQDAA